MENDHHQADADMPTAGVLHVAPHGTFQHHNNSSNKSLVNLATSGEQNWKRALERCVPGIVVLKYALPGVFCQFCMIAVSSQYR